jgi:methylated-DNA-[protein]-cysteine S-methyltransferase
VASPGGLTEIRFLEQQQAEPFESESHADDGTLVEAVAQLRAYFDLRLRQFDLPLAPRGTPFQLKVWRALESIPYGEAISYSELACRIDKPKAVRAVGAANGRNPLPIVIPCHRVVGSDGSLTGYGGGIHKKEYLLLLERTGLLELGSQPSLFQTAEKVGCD